MRYQNGGPNGIEPLKMGKGILEYEYESPLGYQYICARILPPIFGNILKWYLNLPEETVL